MKSKRIGITLIIVGIAGAAILALLGGMSENRSVASFGRANVGCRTWFQFDRPGTYYVFVETGDLRVIDKGCPPSASADELVLSLYSDSRPVALVPDASVGYTYDGSSAVSTSRFELEASGRFELVAVGPNVEQVIALGADPAAARRPWWFASGMILTIGLLGGLVLVFAGRQLRPAGVADPDPASARPARRPRLPANATLDRPAVTPRPATNSSAVTAETPKVGAGKASGTATRPIPPVVPVADTPTDQRRPLSKPVVSSGSTAGVRGRAGQQGDGSGRRSAEGGRGRSGRLDDALLAGGMAGALAGETVGDALDADEPVDPRRSRRRASGRRSVDGAGFGDDGSYDYDFGDDDSGDLDFTDLGFEDDNFDDDVDGGDHFDDDDLVYGDPGRRGSGAAAGRATVGQAFDEFDDFDEFGGPEVEDYPPRRSVRRSRRPRDRGYRPAVEADVVGDYLDEDDLDEPVGRSYVDDEYLDDLEDYDRYDDDTPYRAGAVDDDVDDGYVGRYLGDDDLDDDLDDFVAPPRPRPRRSTKPRPRSAGGQPAPRRRAQSSSARRRRPVDERYSADETDGDRRPRTNRRRSVEPRQSRPGPADPNPDRDVDRGTDRAQFVAGRMLPEQRRTQPRRRRTPPPPPPPGDEWEELPPPTGSVTDGANTNGDEAVVSDEWATDGDDTGAWRWWSPPDPGDRAER